ncbi:MAG TPA: hypothetical protein VHV75_18685 [Solirubrobacteraceae bacterium]|nr:hypothetical protein [Solirubrobacteraceae bacterium]
MAQATRWAEQRNAAVMAARDWELGLAAWWELASLPIEAACYQHLLFEDSPQDVGFARQFFGEEVEVVGFNWQVKRPGRVLPQTPENVVCIYGGLEGQSYEDEDILDFATFRKRVNLYVAEYRAGGVELTGRSWI